MDVYELWLLIVSLALVVMGVVAALAPREPDRKWIRRLHRLQRGRRAMATPTRDGFKSRVRS